jgi:hypothetical protein
MNVQSQTDLMVDLPNEWGFVKPRVWQSNMENQLELWEDILFYIERLYFDVDVNISDKLILAAKNFRF